MKMRKILKRLMDEQGLDAYSMADKSKVPQPTTQRFLSGKHGDPRSSTVAKWAKALGVTESHLRGDDQIDGINPSHVSNVESAPDLRAFQNVPVVGTVQGGDNGYLAELEYPTGQGDGNITYPAKDDNSYALRVRGDSMRPRIKNGEFIVIEPNHEPQPGDDVVVCLKDGRKMVKELLYTRDGEITLGSINNGHGNICVTIDQVEVMHYVAAIIPRGAFYKA